MFQNILVPTDLTDKSGKALDVALKLGGGEFAVTLLHVIEVIEDTDEEFQRFYDKLEKRARGKMAEAAAGFPDQRARIRTEIVFGNRVREVVQYAIERKVDLIVLASHRIEPGDAAGGWATISYRIGILAPCPVMMVK